MHWRNFVMGSGVAMTALLACRVLGANAWLSVALIGWVAADAIRRALTKKLRMWPTPPSQTCTKQTARMRGSGRAPMLSSTSVTYEYDNFIVTYEALA